jgi:uncharacterized membrane protein
MNRPCWWIALGLLGLAVVVSAAVYPQLPERVATHWNMKGEVDGYGPKWVAAWVMPLTMLGILGLLALLPWLSPKNFEIETFRPTYEFLVILITGLFGYIHLVTLAGALDAEFPVGRVLVAGVFLALACMGNVLGRVRRNFFIGVRVPWTLANERVWNDTHRVAAWVFVIAGLLGFILALADQLAVGFGLFVVLMIVPIVYSFVHYKALERRGEI